MIAFVLSGGGPRGALQAGALQVLLENGIYPDILVGTSAGALNAAYLAWQPTPSAAGHLIDIWTRLTRQQIFFGGLLSACWHVLKHGDSLYCNDRLKAFVESTLPSDVHSFHDLARRLYVVATNLATGLPYIFGNDLHEPRVRGLTQGSAAGTCAAKTCRARANFASVESRSASEFQAALARASESSRSIHLTKYAASRAERTGAPPTVT